MNCVNCNAPMKPVADRGYLYCEYCGTFRFPDESTDGVKVFGEKSHLKCTICNVEMQTALVAQKPVLYCPSCKGFLATQDGFAKIVKRMRAHSQKTDPPRRIDPAELERRLACPRCGRAMHTHAYAGPGNVVVDICINCELIFLDHGELSIIRDAPGR